MQIERQSVVWAGEDMPQYASATFPQVVETPAGKLFVSFRAGPKKGPGNWGEMAVFCVSEDGGAHFSEPFAPFAAPLIDGSKPSTLRVVQLLPLGGERLFAVGCAVERSDTDLPYFNETTEGIKRTCLFTAFSSDGGTTFSHLRQLDIGGKYEGLAHVLTGPPVLLGDHRIMVNFEVYKTYDDTRPIDHNAACIFLDETGKAVSEPCTIYDSPHIYAWDHRACELQGGTLYDVFWTFDRDGNCYLPIHGTRSTDGGHSWSTPESTGLIGQPGNAVQLPDGRIALIYIDRSDVPVIRLALSEDMGSTYRDALEIYRHGTQLQEGKKSAYAEAWTEMGKYSAGHPFVILLRDGRLLCIHYAGKDQHHTRIVLTWVRL